MSLSLRFIMLSTRSTKNQSAHHCGIGATLGVRDMSKVQGPDERAQGTHLSQAAEVEMSPMRQSQDAKAKVIYR